MMDSDLMTNITGRKSRWNPNSVKAEENNRPFRGTQAERVKLFLCEWGELTCEEIADGLEMNYTTVSAILSLLKGIGGHVKPAQVVETGRRKPTRRSRGLSKAAVVALTPAVEEEILRAHGFWIDEPLPPPPPADRPEDEDPTLFEKWGGCTSLDDVPEKKFEVGDQAPNVFGENGLSGS